MGFSLRIPLLRSLLNCGLKFTQRSVRWAFCLPNVASHLMSGLKTAKDSFCASLHHTLLCFVHFEIFEGKATLGKLVLWKNGINRAFEKIWRLLFHFISLFCHLFVLVVHHSTPYICHSLLHQHFKQLILLAVLLSFCLLIFRLFNYAFLRLTFFSSHSLFLNLSI